MSTDLVKRGDSPLTAVQKLLGNNAHQLEMATRTIRSDRLIRLATTALTTVPKLQDCTLPSILNSIMTAAQLSLEFNTALGHGWLIPYKTVCTFQPGYRGLIELGYRGDGMKAIQPIIVYDGDVFDYCEGEAPRLVHQPVAPSKRKSDADGYTWVGAYSRAKLPDGSTDILWMWAEEILAIRDKASQAKNNGPWVDWFWEMVKKTPIKRHMKFLRMSGEAATAVGIDDQAEAFAGRSGGTVIDVAQDLVLPESVLDQARDAQDKMQGSHAAQEQSARETIKVYQGIRTPSPAARPPARYVTAQQIAAIQTAAALVELSGDVLTANIRALCGAESIELLPADMFDAVMKALMIPEDPAPMTEAEMQQQTAAADKPVFGMQPTKRGRPKF